MSSKSNESGYDVDAETETLQILQSRIEYLSVSLTVLQDELATSQAILSDLVSGTCATSLRSPRHHSVVSLINCTVTYPPL